MGFAEADAAENEKGIEGAPGTLRNRQRRAVGKLVVTAHNEGREGVQWIERSFVLQFVVFAFLRSRGVFGRFLGGAGGGERRSSADFAHHKIEVHWPNGGTADD